jgi:phosphoribosylaminoimidazolecarboxamide formyltransferase/IMP cyclohydrolase
MVRVAGLASSHGETLLRINDVAPGGASVEVVVSSDPDAAVLRQAAKRGIATEVISTSGETGLGDVLSSYDFDVVCCDSFTGDIPIAMYEELPPVVDTHFSLLPAFSGDDPVQSALEAGVNVTGVSVVLQPLEDPYQIVTQDPVLVYDNDSVGTLRERMSEVARYGSVPRAIRWFAEDRIRVPDDGETVEIDRSESQKFPVQRLSTHELRDELRYGENPHQDASVYLDPTRGSGTVIRAAQLNPSAKALSYNNYNDAEAAVELVHEFDEPAAAVIKHTNPAGCATADTIEEAYAAALATDPMSAFGGVVALNRECDARTATSITDSFKEVVAAPSYTPESLDVFREEENLRVLELGDTDGIDELVRERQLRGGRLVQDRDTLQLTEDDLEVVTDREPTPEQLESMLFGWHVVKHVKSNAIVFTTGTETVGVGAGQMSRVDAVKIAAMKADEHADGKSAVGGVMASDAFFPFPDGIEEAVDAGINGVIQPGGSVNDEKVIEAADEHGVAMVFTGYRCFRHD